MKYTIIILLLFVGTTKGSPVDSAGMYLQKSANNRIATYPVLALAAYFNYLSVSSIQGAYKENFKVMSQSMYVLAAILEGCSIYDLKKAGKKLAVR